MGIFEQEQETSPDSIFGLISEYMAEAMLVENIGCVVMVNYDFLQITLDEIAAYKAVGINYPKTVYQAWDTRNRALLSEGKETLVINLTIVDDGGGNAQTVYNYASLIGSTILSVTVEGQGVDDADVNQVNINTVTGDISLPNAIVGQKVKILYK